MQPTTQAIQIKPRRRGGSKGLCRSGTLQEAVGCMFISVVFTGKALTNSIDRSAQGDGTTQAWTTSNNRWTLAQIHRTELWFWHQCWKPRRSIRELHHPFRRDQDELTFEGHSASDSGRDDSSSQQSHGSGFREQGQDRSMADYAQSNESCRGALSGTSTRFAIRHESSI